jgi:hypothetical protein
MICRKHLWVFFAMGAVFMLALCTIAHADIKNDPRYCGEPARTPAGTIVRSAKVRSDYKKIVPCPITGLSTGACPGWQIDHIVPLVCGGCDRLDNVAWMDNRIKTCADDWCKDRYEQKVFCPGGGFHR